MLDESDIATLTVNARRLTGDRDAAEGIIREVLSAPFAAHMELEDAHRLVTRLCDLWIERHRPELAAANRAVRRHVRREARRGQRAERGRRVEGAVTVRLTPSPALDTLPATN